MSSFKKGDKEEDFWSFDDSVLGSSILSAFFNSRILASLLLSTFWFSICCHLNCSSNSMTFCWLLSSSAWRLSTKSLFKSDSPWRPTINDLNSASVSAEAVWWAKANCKSEIKNLSSFVSSAYSWSKNVWNFIRILKIFLMDIKTKTGKLRF